jgi:hypothetical protein
MQEMKRYETSVITPTLSGKEQAILTFLAVQDGAVTVILPRVQLQRLGEQISELLKP